MIDAATLQWLSQIVHSLAFIFNLLSRSVLCHVLQKSNSKLFVFWNTFLSISCITVFLLELLKHLCFERLTLLSPHCGPNLVRQTGYSCNVSSCTVQWRLHPDCCILQGNKILMSFVRWKRCLGFVVLLKQKGLYLLEAVWLRCVMAFRDTVLLVAL